MALHVRFDEWDPSKARRNLRDHTVSFEDARIALEDRYAEIFHLNRLDVHTETDEERWITLASHPYNRSRVFNIVWTIRTDASGETTRIISARPATPSERRQYEAYTYSQ